MSNQLHLPYSEGTWFAVPLRDQGYATGVVARMAGDGPVFGYFFGPRRKSIPKLRDVEGLLPSGAIWRGQFGDLGLLEDRWPIMGRSSEWRREIWPLVPFIRVDDTSGRAVKVVYSDKNLEFVSEEKCDPTLAAGFPRDALSGYGAVEIRLTKLLGKQDT